ncbi:MAG: glycosyltransferase [Candidatus Aquicultorales bacterium]
MDVLLVNKLYYPHIGGVENHVRTLANGLTDKANVRVLCANTKRRSVVNDVDGLRVTRLPNWYGGLSAPVAPGFLAKLPDSSVDIQHLHFPSGVPEVAYAVKEMGGSLVVTYHSDIVRQKILGRAFKPFAEGMLRKAHRVIVGSPNLIDSSPFLQSIKEKCVVIPFGIDEREFEETPEVTRQAEAIRKKHGERLVFFLGRLIYYKGVEYLISAMKEVQGKLLIGGEGPLEVALKEFAQNLRIRDKVVFLGSIPEEERAAYYKACDVFVLPSIAPSEAYGLCQIEAHMSGKPVVSTNLPTGVPFVNKDGVTGYVVPPADDKALAEAITKLLDDDALRSEMGERAKERALSEFTASTMVGKIFELYEEVLKGGRP